MDDNSLIPFGMYKGKKLANVPSRYLMWLYDQFKKEKKELTSYKKELLKYIEDNMDAMDKELNKENEQGTTV